MTSLQKHNLFSYASDMKYLDDNIFSRKNPTLDKINLWIDWDTIPTEVVHSEAFVITSQ
jgi:hypothetical protein